MKKIKLLQSTKSGSFGDSKETVGQIANHLFTSIVLSRPSGVLVAKVNDCSTPIVLTTISDAKHKEAISIPSERYTAPCNGHAWCTNFQGWRLASPQFNLIIPLRLQATYSGIPVYEMWALFSAIYKEYSMNWHVQDVQKRRCDEAAFRFVVKRDADIEGSWIRQTTADPCFGTRSPKGWARKGARRVWKVPGYVS